MSTAAVQFRAARRDDLPAILALIAQDTTPPDREFVSDPPDPRYLAAFDALAADSNQLLAVAELDGRVVGTLQLTFIPGLAFRGSWRGLIESVRIVDDLRGQGLGTMMMDWAVAQCRERGCRMAQLTSNMNRPDAHRFYERLGWVRSHYGFKLQLED
ncbi:GNAT family N-acetyltransferase [Stakelama tenebrarum]|uniref:GNAT family N-acetyltransferase n=1 Tax=Stakelama tenebrarum TaxID=2711215 RepID=A0A6G6Y6Y2_9SPHN|nr:GNAT family N-acetyltransferase [Sphingosinithalassobacter tenebrarum]QIG80704.1 GNAT family N-acetyltransferase [Sphingosinithalassobacter tenebrarum]